MIKYQSAEEAVGVIRSHQRVFIHSRAATPQRLVDAIVSRHKESTNVEIVHLHIEGNVPYDSS